MTTLLSIGKTKDTVDSQGVKTLNMVERFYFRAGYEPRLMLCLGVQEALGESYLSFHFQFLLFSLGVNL
jgi:hypothetical protein